MKEIIFEKQKITLDLIEQEIGVRPDGLTLGHGRIIVYVKDTFNKDTDLKNLIEPKGFKFKIKKDKD